jgi:hypothetical protein
MIDLFIEFVALVAHGKNRQLREVPAGSRRPYCFGANQASVTALSMICLGLVSAKAAVGPPQLKMKMPKHQCFWQSRDIAKELKPEGTKGNHHSVCADIQKHRMAGFGLRRFRRFNDV